MWLEVLPQSLSRQPDRGEPRARSAEQCRRLHPPCRTRRAHALSRQLRFLRAAAERARGADRGDAQQAGGQGQEAASLCRSLALQGAHRAPGAKPAQGARRDAADRGVGARTRRSCSTFRAPRSSSRRWSCSMASPSAMFPARRCCRSLNLRIDPDDRRGAGRPQRQRQDDLGAAARGSIGTRGRRDRRLKQIAGRLFRPAPDRGAGCRRDAAAAYAEPVAVRVIRARCARSSAASAFPATRPMSRCASSRAASGRGCRSR